mgnify:FL=1
MAQGASLIVILQALALGGILTSPVTLRLPWHTQRTFSLVRFDRLASPLLTFTAMAPVFQRAALDSAQIQQLLITLHDWNWDPHNTTIVKSWTFDSFLNVMSCLTRIAELAEQLNHHPHITTCYTHLRIQLSTHDVQGLTSLDFQLAQAIDTLIERDYTTT